MYKTFSGSPRAEIIDDHDNGDRYKKIFVDAYRHFHDDDYRVTKMVGFMKELFFFKKFYPRAD